MSAREELLAAANAAIVVGLPYTATRSFDTAGHTMMGLHPENFADVFAGLDPQPLAFGANCGTTPEHLRAMRAAIDEHARSTPPSEQTIIERIGPLANASPDAPVR